MLDYRLEDMLRTQLMVSLQNINKWNSQLGIIFSLFLFILFTNFKTFQTFANDTFGTFPDFLNIFGNRSINIIELRGTLIDDIFGSKKYYSKKFMSLLHYIHFIRNNKNKSNPKYCNVEKLLEICINDIDDVLNKREDDLLINQTSPILIANNIYCRFSVLHDDSRLEKTKVKYIIITAKIYSYTLNSSELEKFINKCEQEYEDFLSNKLSQNMYYFIYDKVYDEDGLTYSFKKIKFQSSKTFNNVFFKEKELLQNRLDFFENNKDKYNHLGIPHTFGILMHGEPGTGKTSTIKAIANYTKRHIITIPLYKIKDISVLTNLFLNVDIDGVNVPFDKRIYVFEEIDCNGLKDIVQQRHHNETNDTKSAHLKKINKILSEKNKEVFEELTQEQLQSILTVTSSNNKTDNNKSITLGGILELLDGLIETPGRILIITTNYPNELDQALIRPGRIDMNIHFTKASRQDIASMYEMWYNTPLCQDILQQITEEKYSHAELCQLFFKNLTNPQEVINILLS
jgi:hypothetical protein